jgi:hypothetical protein
VYALQLLFYKILCKGHGLARIVFLASGGQPKARCSQTFPGHDLQLFQISLKIGPTVWISLVDIHTNTHIELYILAGK